MLAYSDPKSSKRADERGKRVFQLIWEPIAQYFSKEETFFIIPDGAIASVPFSALPQENGRYLLEDYQFSYLETAFDLVPIPRKENPPQILLVGDVDYSLFHSLKEKLDFPCLPEQFPDLPETAKEIANIQSFFPKNYAIEVLSQGNASEKAVVNYLSGKSYLHLATHGFFAEGTLAPCLGGFYRSGKEDKLGLKALIF